MNPFPPRNLRPVETQKGESFSRLKVWGGILSSWILFFSIGFYVGKKTSSTSTPSTPSSPPPYEIEVVPPETSIRSFPPSKTEPSVPSTTEEGKGIPFQETTTSPSVSQNLPSVPEGEGKKELSTRKGPIYTIQIASFRDGESADHLLKFLESRGYDAYIEKASLGKKGIWFRVRVGTFSSREEAEKYLERLKGKENLEGYVTVRGR